eukprot:850776-Rhodomonas_salina.1
MTTNSKRRVAAWRLRALARAFPRGGHAACWARGSVTVDSEETRWCLWNRIMIVLVQGILPVRLTVESPCSLEVSLSQHRFCHYGVPLP